MYIERILDGTLDDSAAILLLDEVGRDDVHWQVVGFGHGDKLPVTALPIRHRRPDEAVTCVTG